MSSMDMLKIKNISYSIQREGIHIGKPMLFVEMADSKSNIGEYYLFTKENIFEIVKDNEKKYETEIRTICICGGESLEQDIKELLEFLNENSFTIHLVTNGNKFDEEIAELIHWHILKPDKHNDKYDCRWTDYACEFRFDIKDDVDLKNVLTFNTKKIPTYLKAYDKVSEYVVEFTNMKKTQIEKVKDYIRDVKVCYTWDLEIWGRQNAMMAGSATRHARTLCGGNKGIIKHPEENGKLNLHKYIWVGLGSTDLSCNTPKVPFGSLASQNQTKGKETQNQADFKDLEQLELL